MVFGAANAVATEKIVPVGRVAMMLPFFGRKKTAFQRCGCALFGHEKSPSRFPGGACLVGFRLISYRAVQTEKSCLLPYKNGVVSVSIIEMRAPSGST